MNDSDILGSRRAIFAWLWLLIAMVFGMVVVGGVTRLTGSGLSIVEWAPIMGTLPPLNHADWLAAFAKYQQYPQYRITHPDMTLGEFQGIFFWEYVHRLLGRLVGTVFLLPFLWFWARGCLTHRLRARLLVALGLGGLQGLMGWLMVKSGLVDEPRVSHFRLAVHLGLAFTIMAYLFWLVLQLRGDDGRAAAKAAAPRVLIASVAALTVLQIVYGAFVAGLRAGLVYNTFPKMNGRWIAEGVMGMDPAWLSLLEHDVTIQFVHRWLGTLLLVLVAVLWLRVRAGRFALVQRASAAALMGLVSLQYGLGVYTLIEQVPIVPAVMHQGCASLVLLALVWVLHGFRRTTA